ncbi:MAG: DUF5946 family protein [Erythrobacter sp.]
MSDVETCPGCGFEAPVEDGPIHAYMTSSPACWRHFNAIMAREYSDAMLMPTHYLSVDAFAAQHPGGRTERRARQSVWIHLAGLHAILRDGHQPSYRYDLLRRLADATTDWPEPPKHAAFPIVAGRIAPDLAAADHISMVREWADSTLTVYETATPDLAGQIARLVG